MDLDVENLFDTAIEQQAAMDQTENVHGRREDTATGRGSRVLEPRENLGANAPLGFVFLRNRLTDFPLDARILLGQVAATSANAQPTSATRTAIRLAVRCHEAQVTIVPNVTTAKTGIPARESVSSTPTAPSPAATAQNQRSERDQPANAAAMSGGTVRQRYIERLFA